MWCFCIRTHCPPRRLGSVGLAPPRGHTLGRWGGAGRRPMAEQLGPGSGGSGPSAVPGLVPEPPGWAWPPARVTLAAFGEVLPTPGLLTANHSESPWPAWFPAGLCGHGGVWPWYSPQLPTLCFLARKHRSALSSDLEQRPPRLLARATCTTPPGASQRGFELEPWRSRPPPIELPQQTRGLGLELGACRPPG